MKTTKGRRRALTDAQVQRLLAWHLRLAAWQKQRQQVPTLRAFARTNHIDARSLSRLLPKLDQKLELLVRIRDWHCAHRELLAARAQIETLRGLARELQVSDNTIAAAVRRKGEYKQASPELLSATRFHRKAQLDRLKRLYLY